jgi:hypothetical protein
MLWKSYFLEQNNLQEIALLMRCDYCSIDQWSHWLFVPCSIFLYHENRLCKFTFIITDICITLEERYCFSDINIYFFLCFSFPWSYFFSNWMEISVYTISFFIIWYGEHTWIPLIGIKIQERLAYLERLCLLSQVLILCYLSLDGYLICSSTFLPCT